MGITLLRNETCTQKSHSVRNCWQDANTWPYATLHGTALHSKLYMSGSEGPDPLLNLYNSSTDTQRFTNSVTFARMSSAHFVLNLVFWQALVRVESNVFTVDDRVPWTEPITQTLDKEQI